MSTPTPSATSGPVRGLAAVDLSADQLLALLQQHADGLVHGCGCGVPHPPARSALDVDPGRWRRIRAELLKRDRWQCQVPTPGSGVLGRDGRTEVCGARATVAGHVLARKLGGCDHSRNLRAECKPHSDQDGAHLGNDLRAAAALLRVLQSTPTQRDDLVSLEGGHHLDPAMKLLSLSQDAGANVQVRGGVGAAAGGSPPEAPGVDLATYRSPGPDDPVWDHAPWLADLRDVPPEGTWPRLMTLPHPRAVGSYGLEVEEQFRARTGREPRWWQRLYWRRSLEHDADGVLVWGEYLLSLSRQGGKSWGLRERCLWRIRRGAELWGEQLVMHTGRDKGVVLEVARPAFAWAEANGLHASRNNGREGIGTGETAETGSRWLMRAKDAVYGFSCTAAEVDEGWDVQGRIVDDGLLPTMVEQESPQLGLISTAHRRATGLMLDRRGLAAAQLLEPTDTLLLEWSTPSDVDRADRAGWRMASPHWSPARERTVAKAYRKVLQGESVDPEEPDPVASFDAQWLNRWPGSVRVDVVAKDEPLTDAAAWAACRDLSAVPDPSRPVYVAVEDELGKGAAAAAAALTRDGRVVLGGYRFPTLREAVDWAQDTAEGAQDALMLAGASIYGDPELEGLDLPVDPAGGAEFRDALPTLRALAAAGRLAQDDPAEPGNSLQDATRALITARVRPNAQGAAMLLTECDHPALLRCLAWVTQRAHRDRD